VYNDNRSIRRSVFSLLSTIGWNASASLFKPLSMVFHFDETTNKTGIHWRTDGEVQTCQYDKTLVAVPFSVVRMWRTPTLNPIMTEAVRQ
jgi:hypothetical protein